MCERLTRSVFKKPERLDSKIFREVVENPKFELDLSGFRQFSESKSNLTKKLRNIRARKLKRRAPKKPDCPTTAGTVHAHSVGEPASPRQARLGQSEVRPRMREQSPVKDTGQIRQAEDTLHSQRPEAQTPRNFQEHNMIVDERLDSIQRQGGEVKCFGQREPAQARSRPSKTGAIRPGNRRPHAVSSRFDRVVTHRPGEKPSKTRIKDLLCTSEEDFGEPSLGNNPTAFSDFRVDRQKSPQTRQRVRIVKANKREDSSYHKPQTFEKAKHVKLKDLPAKRRTQNSTQGQKRLLNQTIKKRMRPSRREAGSGENRLIPRVTGRSGRASIDSEEIERKLVFLRNETLNDNLFGGETPSETKSGPQRSNGRIFENKSSGTGLDTQPPKGQQKTVLKQGSGECE